MPPPNKCCIINAKNLISAVVFTQENTIIEIYRVLVYSVVSRFYFVGCTCVF